MPDPQAKLHEHKDFERLGPRAGKKMCVHGRKLVAGDIVEEGDWYESSSGEWLPADNLVGMALQEGAGAIFIRPDAA